MTDKWLTIKRYQQRAGECSIAAASSVAYFFNPNLNYENIRKLVPKNLRKAGLETSEQCSLLNQLGFKKITVVTADLQLFDFSWKKYTRDRLVGRLRKLTKHYHHQQELQMAETVSSIANWLSQPDCDNNIIIDYQFQRHIKKQLNRGLPVIAAINWTSLFKVQKSGGDISGEEEEHAIVIRGYDEKGVFIVDSHSRYYNGALKKYKNGYYKLSWPDFLVNIPRGDLVLVSPPV